MLDISESNKLNQILSSCNDDYIINNDQNTSPINAAFINSYIIHLLERLIATNGFCVNSSCKQCSIDSKFKVMMLYVDGSVVKFTIVRIFNSWHADHITKSS